MTQFRSLGLAAGASLFLIAATAQAEGDVAQGQEVFERSCAQCHSLEEGVKKVGPSLFQIAGSTAASGDGFRYSKILVQAGEAGLVWDAETLANYTLNPQKYLKAFLTEAGVSPTGRSKMTFKFSKKKADLAPHVAAYLLSLSEGQ